MPRLLAAFTAGAFTASAYRARRDVAREWRWVCRDLREFRAELARYFEAR